MKKMFFTALVTLFAWMASADVTITNLVAAQRPGTKLMDITYDVSSTATTQVWISLTVSNSTTVVTATNLTGDVGAAVATGTNKLIVWNMGTDWNTNAANLNFSVWADDGFYPCPVAKTGQTTSYRAGDDGDLEGGVAWPNPRFTDLSDGTVKDHMTGLQWVKAPHALSGNSGTMNWNSAIDFCNSLEYASYSDWRLPSVRELESLVNCGTYSPALPVGHPFSGVKTNYWLGTSVASSIGGEAWFVSMYDGRVITYPKTGSYSSFCAWPVRGGQAMESVSPVPKTGQTTSFRAGDDGDLETGVAWPNPRFTDLSDGTVKDNLTGLQWVQAPHSLLGNSGRKAWTNAIDFCNGLIYASHSDWRLPSRRELMSLVDYGRNSPSLPVGHPFSGVQYSSGYYYWSGTSMLSMSGYAVVVRMDDGAAFPYERIGGGSVCCVWPVRGGQ